MQAGVVGTKLNCSIRSMSNSQLFNNHHGSHALFSFISLDSKCIPYVFILYYPVYSFVDFNKSSLQKKKKKNSTIFSSYYLGFDYISFLQSRFLSRLASMHRGAVRAMHMFVTLLSDLDLTKDVMLPRSYDDLHLLIQQLAMCCTMVDGSTVFIPQSVTNLMDQVQVDTIL